MSNEEDFASLLGHYLVRMGFKQQELANKIGMHRNTIVNWLNRTSQPTSRAQVLRVADELSLSKQERKILIQAAGFPLERWPTEVWTVPQQRDMFFTGRDNVFQSLRELLVLGSTTALTQAISGLGGIGKTHTAVEYAYRFHKEYEAVLWVQADSWEVLVSACMELIGELELPEQKEADQVVAEVQHWLRKHHHWLLILDNVENPQEILPKFVPTGHQGFVLVTTRVHNVEPLAQTQVLATMSEQEGVLFLLRRTKKIPSASGLEQASSAQRDETQQIWQLMDGLPLALDQAGAYMLETSCSFPAYREQYTRRRAELLHQRGKRFISHEASVATTLSLAFERVEALNPVAADILRTCSLLHNEAIPEEFFQEGAEHLGPRLANDRDSWDPAIGVLQDYSLMQHNADAKTLAVHRLVQAVLQDTLSEQKREEEWTLRIIAAMNSVFPKAEHTTWSKCARLVSHALACVARTQSWENTNTDLASLLFKIATYLHTRAQYAEAEPLYQRALHIREQVQGPNHPDVAHTLNNLAVLYAQQSKYTELEPLYQRALHIWEQALGPEHPQVAYALNNLAILYAQQSKYEQAEPFYQRALRIREQALGPEHPQVAALLNNLAELYRTQGKYEQAELLYQRALHIREQVQGPDHPDVVFPLNNLAILYFEQGKYEQAELLYQRALHIQEQTLDPEHPDVAFPLNNLADLYREQGKYIQAESLYRQVLHIREQALAPEHPLVAYTLNGLANLYREQGKYEQAEPLYEQALHIKEQAQGSEHPETAETMHDLARLRDAQGNSEEARVWYARALAIREQALGKNHRKTMETRKHFIALLHAMGQHEEATQTEQRTNEKEQKTHPEG